MLTSLDHHAHLELFRDASGTLDYVTCDQASLVCFQTVKCLYQAYLPAANIKGRLIAGY